MDENRSSRAGRHARSTTSNSSGPARNAPGSDVPSASSHCAIRPIVNPVVTSSILEPRSNFNAREN